MRQKTDRTMSCPYEKRKEKEWFETIPYNFWHDIP